MHQALKTESANLGSDYISLLTNCMTLLKVLIPLEPQFPCEKCGGGGRAGMIRVLDSSELMGGLNRIILVTCSGRGTDCVLSLEWGDHRLHQGLRFPPAEIHSTERP